MRILLRFQKLKERVPFSRSEISRRIKAGTFPAPISIGKSAVAWDSLEVDAWIERQVEEGKQFTKASNPNAAAAVSAYWADVKAGRRKRAVRKETARAAA